MKKKSKKKRALKRSKKSGPVQKKVKHIPFWAKDLLSIKEINGSDIEMLFKLADKMKKKPQSFYGKLKGKALALLFQKPSVRTRVSFQVGMSQLGANSVYMDPQEMPLGERESIKDVARVLSRYCDAVVARTHLHSDVEEFARYSR